MPENWKALLFTYPNGLQWEEIVFILCFCHYHLVPSRDLAHLLLPGYLQCGPTWSSQLLRCQALPIFTTLLPEQSF